MLTGMIFPKSDQDALFKGTKTTAIVEGKISLEIGVTYPVYISESDDPFNGQSEKKVGRATVLETSCKTLSGLTAGEVEVSHGDHAEIREEIRKRGMLLLASDPIVTCVKFDMKFDWPIVKKIVGGPEIEFLLTEADQDFFDRSEKIIEWMPVYEVYYDQTDFSLAKKNKWFFYGGDGAWRLLIPVDDKGYKEVTNEEEIKSQLHIDSLDVVGPLKAGYRKFSTLSSVKRIFRIGNHLIETEIVTMPSNGSRYYLGRISPLVACDDPIESLRGIRKFCADNGFALGRKRKKIMEYLRIAFPEVHADLVDAGIPE